MTSFHEQFATSTYYKHRIFLHHQFLLRIGFAKLTRRRADSKKVVFETNWSRGEDNSEPVLLSGRFRILHFLLHDGLSAQNLGS